MASGDYMFDTWEQVSDAVYYDWELRLNSYISDRVSTVSIFDDLRNWEYCKDNLDHQTEICEFEEVGEEYPGDQWDQDLYDSIRGLIERFFERLKSCKIYEEDLEEINEFVAQFFNS